MEYRPATPADLTCLWDRNIAEHPEDPRWVNWKQQYIAYNQARQAITFCVVREGKAIGEGTLILSSRCQAVCGRSALCNDHDIANINALRIQEEFEGQGHISRLVKEIENFARLNHISLLTIGVEAKETRNLAIYLHWGYREFLMSEMEDGELILYFGKRLDGTEN